VKEIATMGGHLIENEMTGNLNEAEKEIGM
jgi:hypothetical protein